MAVESVNRAPSFKGGYYKLFNNWENALKQGNAKVPIENVVREANDVVILTVSGKGRYWNVCEKIDCIFKKTPIVLTDNEAFSYRILTEKAGAKAHEALNYVMKHALEIIKPDNKIVRHESIEALQPYLIEGMSHIAGLPSPCKKVPSITGRFPHLAVTYNEAAPLPSQEALRLLKRGYNVKKLHSIDFNAVR